MTVHFLKRFAAEVRFLTNVAHNVRSERKEVGLPQH